MDDDWDLHAVVRGCSATSSAATTTTTSTTSSSDVGFHPLLSTTFQPQQQEDEDGDKLFGFQDLFFEPKNENKTVKNTCSTKIEELHDVFKPFFNKSSSSPPPPTKNIRVSPLSVLAAFQDLSSPQQHTQQVQQKQNQVQLQQQQLLLQQNQLHKPKQLSSSSSSSGVTRSSNNTSGSNGTISHAQSPRSKRRKNQMKRVCQVPAEGLSSDMWSWRKYGQKPIKGSPYPRGYYRCSTSKGCLARKQVERNKSDPNMFIVTYTGEHNHPMPTHRNSLAGSTRQKPATSGDANKPNSSPPAPDKLESSREEEKEDIIEEEDDDFSISDVPLDDDFFVGLDEELTGPGPSPANTDCFSDHFSAQFPWTSNNVTTAAADGG